MSDATPTPNADAVQIASTMDAAIPPFGAGIPQQMALLYELPLKLGNETKLDDLLQIVVEELVEVIPGATRGALLVRDSPLSSNLLLKAHVPSGHPSVSLTLAKRAIDERKAFIWVRDDSPTPSQVEYRIQTGMYAPLLWRHDVLGVVCVDRMDAHEEFTPEQLQLLVAISRYAAMAIAHHCIQAELRLNTKLLERLLTNFSPKIRQTLLEKARSGKLRLGGEKSEVTILMSDMRGFTRLCAGMDSEDVADMLNDYLQALTAAIFQHDGTIDKFIGDAILAVFGSPDRDAEQHGKAVRAALDMQHAVALVNHKRANQSQTMCEIGIGVHCGEVLHGFIGGPDRMEFTVIGDAVNRTSRYCAAAAGNQIIVSPEMYQRVWRNFEGEPVCVPTKHEGDFKAFRIIQAKSVAGPVDTSPRTP